MKKVLIFYIVLICSMLLANFIWPPYLTNQGETYATINFKTLDENIQVNLYENDVLFKSIDNLSPGLVHVKFNDLKPATKYYFEVKTNDDYYKGYFYTKDNTKTLRFIVYGDTRYYDKQHKMIVDKIIEEKPEFVLNVGDLVENGNELRYWNNFFNIIKGLNAFYYPVLGNHERNSKNYYEAFDLPEGGGDYGKRWYSFSYGNNHFIILDTTNISTDSDLFYEQTNWMINEFENNKEKNFFVFYHYPFWNNSSVSWRRQFDKLENAWRPIFEKYNVKLVFNGHIHAYERFEKNGITYITTGGGGAPFDPGAKKDILPHTKKYVYGVLEYVLVEVSAEKIRVIVKGVGESKDFDVRKAEKIDRMLDYIEIPLNKGY